MGDVRKQKCLYHKLASDNLKSFSSILGLHQWKVMLKSWQNAAFEYFEFLESEKFTQLNILK